MDSVASVYHIKEEEPVGWILLSLLLGIGLIVFLLLWIFNVNAQHNQSSTGVCFGPFGVESGVDANALTVCGTNSSDPCIFAINTLTDAEAQCNTLSSVCNAFTFNASTSTMKIVQPNSTYISPSTNLFVRQSGLV